ncbi:MAG: dephospho-CoA kinase [Nitrospinota bacterium]|jgi:dephospho-CoA kinase|nr:dephospho-CoA kinase [Nitrospinota bacterium]HJM42373.1 dephospho-CoA kinase [Nitrospinota bacterium]
MLKVGLTGGIASGKSTVAEMFRRHGAHLIDADRVSRDVVAPGRPALEEIVEAFGRGVLRPDGALDRAALGAIVFNDDDARARLNAIVHPRIWEEEDRLCAIYEARDPDGIVMIDAAVIIEAGGADRVDLMVVVDVDAEEQLARLVAKGMSEEEARARIRSQMPAVEKRTYGDYVLNNRGSVEETGRQVERVWGELAARAMEKRY